MDIVVVAVVKLIAVDDGTRPGMVLFQAVVETCFINGATGSITGPHQVRGLLKDPNYMNTVITHARRTLADARPEHPLIVAKWHKLPESKHTLAKPVNT